jgi:hypothetical protein
MSGISDTGSIRFALIYRDVWPQPSKFSLINPVLLKELKGFAVVHLVAHPDGHITLKIDRPDGSPLHDIELQRVHLVGQGVCHVLISWNQSYACIYMDAKLLGPYKLEDPALKIELRGIVIGTSSPSIDHPDATNACQIWIQNRQRKFSAPNLRTGRRLKTISEQARDLFIAVNNLRTIASAIHTNGQKHLIGYLAAELRALVFWSKDDGRDGGYNPLLLRMASKGDLPLPVFAWKNMFSGKVSVLNKANFHMPQLSATIEKTSNDQILMDFQEWLKEDFTVFRMDVGTLGQTERRLPLKEIIAETANSLGVAHYDEDISETVSTMSDTVFAQIDLLARCLCQTAILTADLGIWVLSKLHERALISLPEVNGVNPP